MRRKRLTRNKRMPLYDFEIVNGKTFVVEATVSIRLPVGDREAMVLRRKTVPDHLTVMGHAGDPMEFTSSVMRGYHKKEEREGSRFKSEFTKQQILKIHSTPD